MNHKLGPRLDAVLEAIAGEPGPEGTYTEEMVDRLVIAAADDLAEAEAALASANAGREAAIEEAATVADERRRHWAVHYKAQYAKSRLNEAEHIATAIRALLPKAGVTNE